MNSDAIIQVLCVDDHPLVRRGIAALIDSEPGMAFAGGVSNGTEALQMFRESIPDVTLMDMRLADMSGIDTLTSILEEFPDSKIVMLTMVDGDFEIQRALKAGASGYVLKSMPSEELISTIRRVHKGQKHVPPEVAANLAMHLADETLTPREIEVLNLISNGNRNQDIAEQLFISEQTVKAHVNHILGKLGASDRTEAVSIGLRRGIIHL